MAEPSVVTLRLEAFAAPLLESLAALLVEVENADRALMPDAVVERAADARRAFEAWLPL